MHGFQPGIWILCSIIFYFTLQKLNFLHSEARLSSIMQNWKKLLRFHYCIHKGVTNFECLLLNLPTLNYHIARNHFWTPPTLNKMARRPKMAPCPTTRTAWTSKPLLWHPLLNLKRPTSLGEMNLRKNKAAVPLCEIKWSKAKKEKKKIRKKHSKTSPKKRYWIQF